MGEAAVRIVLANMNDLAIHETRFLCGVTLEVAFLKDELMRLQAYLKDADTKWRSGNARVAIWRSQIRDTSYEAENVIEAADYMEKRNRLKKGFMGAISRYASLPSDLVTLHKIGIEIQRVRRKLSEIFQSADRLKIVMDSTTVVEDESPQDFSLVHQYYEDDVVMVGFQDEHKQIVDKLVDNEKMLSVVAIVAMGGAGKTTLARKVYTSSRIKEHFEILAWVTVSQTFKGIDLLKDILKQVVEDRDEPTSIDQMNEYEVRKKMSDLLLQKRYLVALDDVWEANTWKQMNKTVQAFPDVYNGQTGASSAEIMIPHRSCFQTLSGQIVPATPKVRTVLGFGLSSASLPKLRFLRVLHIENSSLKDLYMIIDGCIHLRCLRLRKCKHVKLPSSIGNLLYLQTIDLRGTTFNSVVPYSLWDIPTLRHVYLSDEFSPPPPTMRVHQQQQKEIRTFELILTSVGTKFRYRDMAIYLGQMKQLTTFSLIMEPISAEIISIFANMPHLVDIYLVKFCVINKLSAEFPQSLRRLVVEADAITEDPMPVIEKLPCLVVLELSGYKGHTMCCSAQGFSRLQELALTAFSTAEWKIEVGSMPKLSRMTLRYCECMSRLPQGLLHLPNLGYLKLEHMPQIAEDDNMLRALMQKGCEVRT
ncbi:hypothetical protein D1007_08298 [Hordeum vulgare]|nr:hypothetical protein D1007_08298 [Hordeum vulgare]